MTILTVQSLVGGYGAVQILQDISMTVAAGQIVALVGANGAGIKMTALTSAMQWKCLVVNHLILVIIVLKKRGKLIGQHKNVGRR